MSTPQLLVAIQARLGNFTLDATFDTPALGITAIVGPSGAGKSTLLRMIAGVQRPDTGRIALGAVTWHDSATRTHCPPNRRSVGYVSQDGALFPHLDVRSNLDFGQVRTPETERSLTPAWVIETLALAPLLTRMPGQLSGGERQRVAMGRALLAGPRLLLLDEPVSALDESHRNDILPLLAKLHRTLRIPIVLVTHSLADVARLGDSVVQMSGGKTLRSGSLTALLPHLSCPAERLAILEGCVGSVDAAHHLVSVDTAFGPLWASHVAPLGTRVRLVMAARELSIAQTVDPTASILNQPTVRIATVESAGVGQLLLTLAPPTGDAPERLAALLTTRSWEALGLACGDQVVARVKGVAVAAA